MVTLCILLIRSWCSSKRAELSTGYRRPGWWSELATSSRSTQPTRLERWDTHVVVAVVCSVLIRASIRPTITHLLLSCLSQVVSSHETQAQEDDPHTVRIDFEPALYQCFENCGSLKLTVARHGGDSGVTVKVCGIVKKNCACLRERSQKTPRQQNGWGQRKLWSDFTHVFGSLPSLALVPD